jgi:hypothetical protein
MGLLVNLFSANVVTLACNSQLIKDNMYTISVVVNIIILFIIVDEAKAVRAFTRIFVLTAAGNG